MHTLEDLFKLFQNFEMGKRLFGATKEVQELFDEKLKGIGEALCWERGITSEEALSLPRDTSFGEQSEPKFLDLKRWLEGLKKE